MKKVKKHCKNPEGVDCDCDCVHGIDVEEDVNECPYCHSELYIKKKCKSGMDSNLPILIGIAVLVVVLYFVFRNPNGKKPTNEEIPIADSIATISETQPDTTVTISKQQRDTVVVINAEKPHDTVVVTETRVDTVKIEKVVEYEILPQKKKKITTTTTTPTQSSSSTLNGTLQLSYGKYTGDTKGGYPHGQGRLIYSTRRQIYRNDIKKRFANAGDYVIGEFYHGFLVYGKHYDAQGHLLESLNFGVGSEESYESK